ncbi:6768_t:CDS:1 [Paraglomus brasilianum]|uniref:6768_t:CDS:1 n=1 Tax=Paraglomus brasilianum TaxID=144538 RepID=A0A9N9GFE7_9GLOM|nr:6768_t:CDS:1 [Paraglomus brasilianum]
MDTEEQAPFNVNPPASGFSVVAGPSSFSGFGEQRTMVTLKSNTSANPFSNNNNGSGGFGFGGFGGFGQNTSYSNPVEEKKVTSFSGFGNPSLPNASDSTKGFGFGFGSVSNASDLGEKKDTSTFGGIGGSFSLKVSPNASKTVKKNKDKVSPFGQGSLNNNNKSSLFGGLNPNASDSTKAFGGFGNVSNVTDSSEKKNVFGGGSFGRSGFGNVGPNASDSTDGKKAKAFGSAFGSGKSKSNAGNKDGAQGFGFGTR